MSFYKCIETSTNKSIEIEAVSSKQALYKIAISKVKSIDKKIKKLEAGKLYESMLKSYKAVLINNPNQLSIFNEKD